jgi:hypothetical protein
MPWGLRAGFAAGDCFARALGVQMVAGFAISECCARASWLGRSTAGDCLAQACIKAGEAAAGEQEKRRACVRCRRQRSSAGKRRAAGKSRAAGRATVAGVRLFRGDGWGLVGARRTADGGCFGGRWGRVGARRTAAVASVRPLRAGRARAGTSGGSLHCPLNG